MKKLFFVATLFVASFGATVSAKDVKLPVREDCVTTTTTTTTTSGETTTTTTTTTCSGGYGCN